MSGVIEAVVELCRFEVNDRHNSVGILLLVEPENNDFIMAAKDDGGRRAAYRCDDIFAAAILARHATGRLDEFFHEDANLLPCATIDEAKGTVFANAFSAGEFAFDAYEKFFFGDPAARL